MLTDSRMLVTAVRFLRAGWKALSGCNVCSGCIKKISSRWFKVLVFTCLTLVSVKVILTLRSPSYHRESLLLQWKGEAFKQERQADDRICLLLSFREINQFHLSQMNHTDHAQGFLPLVPFANITNPDWTPKAAMCHIGAYTVLFNLFLADKQFGYNESVTYVSHSDYRYLDNLEEIVQRWNGPLSVAVFAPGTDLIHTILTILELRCCVKSVRDYVTFHVFYDTEYTFDVDEIILQTFLAPSQSPECISFEKNIRGATFRQKFNMLYPINTARNIGRMAARTHYILVSDIELYPAANFPTLFLSMIAKYNKLKPSIITVNGKKLVNPVTMITRKVYVLPVFEVKQDESAPLTKSGLLAMLKDGAARVFHVKICSACHLIPWYTEWVKSARKDGKIAVFRMAKRYGKFARWEPVYVGTRSDPFFDERLSWEGQRDKMTQMYELCLRNYSLLILDDAFMIHRPGIKVKHPEPWREPIIHQQSLFIKSIQSEMHYRGMYNHRCRM